MERKERKAARDLKPPGKSMAQREEALWLMQLEGMGRLRSGSLVGGPWGGNNPAVNV